MSSLRINLLDIVCHPTSTIPIRHRLAMLACPNPMSIQVRTTAGSQSLDDAVVWRGSQAGAHVLVALPDVDAPTSAILDIAENTELEVATGPVEPFDVFLMPSSHLCFGYFTGLPEHIEAGRVVAEAVEMIESTPDYCWNIEFTRAMENLVAKYPNLAQLARRQYNEGRLDVSAIWAPSYFENYSSEAQIRQIIEAQWWLRESLGSISPMVMGCDSPGFDPQQPQVFRQAGVHFFWRGRYTLWKKDFGSPFINHVGVDGSQLPCFVTRTPISDFYICPPIYEMWVPGRLADRASADFGEMVARTDKYIRDSREICGVGFNVHFASSDQGRSDPAQVKRVETWNRIFCTPRLTFSSMSAMAEKLVSTPSFLRDEQEPEQPGWAPFSVAAYGLTLEFQEASYALATAEIGLEPPEG